MKKHEPCEYVTAEIGQDSDADINLLKELPEVVDEIVDRIQADAQGDLHRHSFAFEPGWYAPLALRVLGCDACRLSGVCPVEARMRQGDNEHSRFAVLLRARAEAQNTNRFGPDWLIQGRLHRTGVEMHFNQLLKQYSSLSDDGRIAIDIDGLAYKLIESTGGILISYDTPVAVRAKADIPEILDISAIPEHQQLNGLVLTARLAHSYEVFDARDAIGFTDKSLSENEFAILSAKFLGRMIETGADGKPAILSPDNTMQKVITRVEGGMLCEMRMSGKNRLYFTVCTIDSERTRIVLLGSHGGDEATQQKFIRKILPN